MAIDFPNNPNNGDTYTVGSIVWTWNSTKSVWEVSPLAGPQGPQGPQGVIGPQGAQGPQGATGAAPTAIVLNAKTDSYTLASGDEGEIIEMGKATAQTVTIPSHATTAFATGTQITIIQTGAGQVTIAGATSPNTVTVNATPGLKLRAQWSSCTLIKRDTNTWVAIGDLVA